MGDSPFSWFFRSQSTAEVRDIVRQAVARDHAVYPVGGGTMLGLGQTGTRPGVIVDLRGLDRIVDYPARDMTITVGAGITFAKLADVLRAENQRLPVDVPRADEATLGGAIAANASGPRRYGFGTLRDYVIGIRVVNDEGQEVKAGGRVVKNVAGYDLCKLYIGSLGTLGIITQVTLKLRPQPEEQALVALRCHAESLETLLESLHTSRTRPVCLEVLNAKAAQWVEGQANVRLPGTPWVVLVGFEGNREAVGWQVEQLQSETALFGPTEACVGTSSGPLWTSLIELPGLSAEWSFKANLLPRAVASFCRRAEKLSDTVLLQAHAGNGIVTGHFEGGQSIGQAQGLLQSLQQEARAAAGNVIVLRCPAAWSPRLPVWGLARGDAWLMRAVKQKLDPHDLFNPGRFSWTDEG